MWRPAQNFIWIHLKMKTHALQQRPFISTQQFVSASKSHRTIRSTWALDQVDMKLLGAAQR